MEKIKVIGICGFKGSGKDTLANYFLDMGYEKDSFASSLKDVLAVVFSWDRNVLEGIKKEDRDWRETPDAWWENKLNWYENPLSQKYPRFTPRVAMQTVGTELFRNIMSEDLWKLSLERRLTRRDRVVITDCRYPNEIDMVKSYGGKVIRVKRGPDPEWVETGIIAAKECEENNVNSFMSRSVIEMERLGIHSSEWAWLGTDFDLIINNNQSPSDMYKLVKTLI